MERTLWVANDIDGSSKNEHAADVEAGRYKAAGENDEANLISSLLEDGAHMPTLDIDLPCHLFESSTPGHFHLLIDKAMTWEQYRVLLAVLADVGIIEEGYYRASVKRGQTFLRRPGVTK